MNRSTILGYAVGPVGGGVLSIFTLPILTWVFLPEDIGKLAMLQVAISFSTLLFCLGLDQAYVRDYHDVEDKNSLFLVSVLPGFILLLVASMLLIWVSPNFLSLLLFDEDSRSISLIVVASLLVSYLSRYLSLILRMQDRSFAFSMSQLLAKLLLLAIVATYLFIESPRLFIMLLSAQAAALALTFLVFSWNTRQDWLPALRTSFDLGLLRRSLAFGLPLVFAGMASWGINSIDRMLLRSTSTYEELAVYSISVSLAAAVTILAGIFNTIWAPYVFKLNAQRDDLLFIESIAHQIMAVATVIICGVGAFSWVVAYVVPEAYAEVPYILLGCMLAPLFYTLSDVTGIGIYLTKKTSLAIIAPSIGILMGGGLGWWLVPHFGARGAMSATVVSFWVFFITRTLIAGVVWRKIGWGGLHLKAFVLVIGVITFGFYGSRYPTIALSTSGVLCFVSLAMQRKELLSIWTYIKNDY